jgi:hypothetical protein
MRAAPEAIYGNKFSFWKGLEAVWIRTMVKMSDRDCLLEDNSADGALGSAIGRFEDDEAFLKPSSS